jgi:proline dehydrogenase
MENSSVSQRFTSRFVAGQSLEEGIRVLNKLQAEQITATLDCLGENVTSLQEAAQSREAYLKALEAIRVNQLQSTVSIKLTQFGLDFSDEACMNNVIALVEQARLMGSRVEIDMESSEYTDRTLQIVTSLHHRFGGFVRAVIQAYLYRSEDDIRALNGQGIPIRLCKGAYREPGEVAFPLKADVDSNYVKLMKLLLDEGTNPAIASHDESIVTQALQHVREQKIAADRFEFQMLYGIRRDLQRRLTADGYRLRLYVPYGDAWYPYFMRRLAERPANVFFIAKNLIRS